MPVLAFGAISENFANKGKNTNEGGQKMLRQFFDIYQAKNKKKQIFAEKTQEIARINRSKKSKLTPQKGVSLGFEAESS